MTEGEPTHIPIKDPEGDSDPATQEWRAANWEGHDRAEAMAQDEHARLARAGHHGALNEAAGYRSVADAKRENAQDIANQGVLTRSETKLVRDLRDEADRYDRAAVEREEAAGSPRAAEVYEKIAGEVYDAKQTLPENTEPFNQEVGDKDEKLRTVEGRIIEALDEAKEGYAQARQLEDMVAEARKLARGIEDKTASVLGDPARQEHDPALGNYLDSTSKLMNQLQEKTRAEADLIFRRGEDLQKLQAQIKEHYETHGGQLYDNALEEMTDERVPFEANNPVVNNDQEQAAA